MRTLVIDCATENCSTALFATNGDHGEFLRLIGERSARLGRGHAERIVPMIADLPEKGRAARIAVAVGPGSFTGIRVGIAAARALALAWNATLVGYPTLALVAAQARAAIDLDRSRVAVVNAAGHGEWFVQQFGPDGLAEDDPRSLTPADAAAAIDCTDIAGSRAEAFVAQRGSGMAHDILPEAAAFALLPTVCLMADPHPAYGRGPDATLPGGGRA